MKRNDALALARQYKKILRDEGVPVTSFLVFGSVAKGNMHEQSDIDIAVIGEPFKGDRFEEMKHIRLLRHPISFRLQPLWFYREHLEDKYSTLAEEIRNSGIRI